MSKERKIRLFESSEEYRERMAHEALLGRIERTTHETPKQGFFESDEHFEGRLPLEADESDMKHASGIAPKQGLFESDEKYQERIHRDALESVIEEVDKERPRQGLFESQEDYEERLEFSSKEAVIERATGEAPKQGFFESNDAYEARISREAEEHSSDDCSESKDGGCFLTTACVVEAGLPDDCHELVTLRAFRDGFLAQQSDGPAKIAEYYAEAPKLVERIQASPTRREILRMILGEIRSAVREIEANRPLQALAIYTRLFEGLRQRSVSHD